MSEARVSTTHTSSVSRRGFLKVAGAGAAGSALVTMLDARQAPAQTSFAAALGKLKL